MNRRGFLRGILGAAVALDPDRLLWMPGKKVYSIPNPSLDFLSLDEFSRRYLMPAARNYADRMDRNLLMMAPFRKGPGNRFNPRTPVPLDLYEQLRVHRLKYACAIGTGWLDGVFK